MGCHFLYQGIFPTRDQTWVSYTEDRDSLPSEPLGKPVCHIRAMQFALSHKHQLFLEKCKAVNRILPHTLEKSAGNLHLRTCPTDCVLSPRSWDQLPIRECSCAEILKVCKWRNSWTHPWASPELTGISLIENCFSCPICFWGSWRCLKEDAGMALQGSTLIRRILLIEKAFLTEKKIL